MVRPVSTSPALDPWEHVARTFEPARPSRWPTPGALARHLNPRTIQTPALDLIDQDLVEAATTPDARLIITMAPQEGKALALDTPVPTPTGWTTMGALTVGDQVIGGDGRPCRVTWVSPTWTGRDCYAVTTGDGERIVADAAHEWVAKLDRRRSARIVETTDLAKVRSKAAQITTAQQGLDLPEADLPLDPYVLGVWLGDGTTGQAAITCHPGDVAIRDRFAAAGWPLRHLGRMCWTMTPEAPNGTYGHGKPSPAKAALRAAGVLTNNGSGALSYTATSTGGNGGTDDGKLVKFSEGNGSIIATAVVRVKPYGGGSGYIQIEPTRVVFIRGAGDYCNIYPPTEAGAYSFYLPSVAGAGSHTLVLEDGNITGKWMGFNWVPYELLTGTSTKTAVAWAKSGCHAGYAMQGMVDIGPRRDKRNLIQIYVPLSIGSVRVNEYKVVTIDYVV